jgi:hypothetical protein
MRSRNSGNYAIGWRRRLLLDIRVNGEIPRSHMLFDPFGEGC